jgi:hypothetical protein
MEKIENKNEKQRENAVKASDVLVGIAGIYPEAETPYFELFLKMDPRIVMDKLDKKFGSLGWKKETSVETVDGKDVIKCTLSVKSDGEWISRDDHSGGAAWAETQEAKVMEADALRRAAVQFGVGRELYTFKNITAPLNDSKGIPVLNYFKIKDTEKYYSNDLLYVEQLNYDDEYNITALSIKNQTKGGKRVCLDDRRAALKQTTTFETDLNTARNTEGDIGAFIGRKIGDIPAEELFYLWKNTKSPDVRKACVVVAKHTPEAKEIFVRDDVKL